VATALKSPFWKTGGTLLVLLGLGAWIYFVEMKKEPGGEKKKEKLFALERAKVKELTLRRGSESVHLVRDGDVWRMTSPLTAPADAEATGALLGAMEGLEVDAVAVENASALAPYGLDPPKTKLSVVVEGAAAPLELLVGDEVPAAGGVYAKRPSEARVIVIPSFAASSLEKKPFDLRDRDLLHAKRENVRSLEIAGPEGGYALAKGDKDEWAFTKPLSTRAGRWSVDSLLGAIEGLRMDSVAAEDAKDLKPFGLAKPSRTVALGLADGSSKTLEIGGSAGDKKWNAHVPGSPLVAVIPGALVDDLAKGMKELRAKRLIELATYEVDGFDVVLGPASQVYAKSASKDKDGVEKAQWKRTAPDKKDLDTNKVEDALFKLGGVEVQEFVDQPKDASVYGLSAPAPALKVVLRRSSGKGEVLVEIGRKDGAVYARRPGDAAVLKLDPAKAEELIKGFKEL
jgi:hypothetical protein